MTPISRRCSSLLSLSDDSLIEIALFVGPDCFFKTINVDGKSYRSAAGGFVLTNKRIHTLTAEVQQRFIKSVFPERYLSVRAAFLSVLPTISIPEEPPIPLPIEEGRRLQDAKHLVVLFQLHLQRISERECQCLFETLILRKQRLAAECAVNATGYYEGLKTSAGNALLRENYDQALFTANLLPENWQSVDLPEDWRRSLLYSCAERFSTQPGTHSRALSLIHSLLPPRAPDEWTQTVTVYMQCNRLDDALLATKLTVPEMLYYSIANKLAEAFENSKQPDKAKEARGLIAAKHISDTEVPSLSLQLEICLKEKRYDDALSIAHTLPKNKATYLLCTLAEQLSENPDRRDQAFTLIRQISPGYPPVCLHLMALVYTRCNRLDDALQVARMIDLPEYNYIKEELAKAFERLGQPGKAQEARSLIRWVPIRRS